MHRPTYTPVSKFKTHINVANTILYFNQEKKKMTQFYSLAVALIAIFSLASSDINCVTAKGVTDYRKNPVTTEAVSSPLSNQIARPRFILNISAQTLTKTRETNLFALWHLHYVAYCSVLCKDCPGFLFQRLITYLFVGWIQQYFAEWRRHTHCSKYILTFAVWVHQKISIRNIFSVTVFVQIFHLIAFI